jgi:hypothetical protein
MAAPPLATYRAVAGVVPGPGHAAGVGGVSSAAASHGRGGPMSFSELYCRVAAVARAAVGEHGLAPFLVPSTSDRPPPACHVSA